MKNIFGKREEPAPAVSRLAWVTKNRPHQLLESVESFVPTVLEHNYSVCFCIYDDSDDASDTAHIKEGLLEFRKKYEVPVRLVTKKYRLEFAERLKIEGKKKNIPPEIIDFALRDMYRAGKALGINRNIALLDNFGHCIIFNDDDVFNNFTRLPCYKPGVQLTSVVNPRRMQLFESREALLDYINPIDIDVIAEHQYYLGTSIHVIIEKEEKRGVPVDPSSSSKEIGNNRSDQRGRVVITLPGIFGVNTGKIPSSFLMWRPGAPGWTYSGEGEYYRKVLSGECIYAPPVTTITDKAYLTTPHFGLDVRNPLPPFFPIFRGQDKIFGLLTKRCFPDYRYLYPSFAIFHNRKESKAFERGDLIMLSNSFSFQFSLLLDTFIGTRSHVLSGNDAKLSLPKIGNTSDRFACQSDSGFTGYLRELFRNYFKNYAEFLSNMTSPPAEEPEWWVKDVERCRQVVLAASEREDIIIPDEIKSMTSSLAEAVTFYKQLLSRYGKLCRHWEDIIEMARGCKMPGEI